MGNSSKQNLGGKLPWDDFKITVKGGLFGENYYYRRNADIIPNDNVVVNVQSKHQSNIKTHQNYLFIITQVCIINYFESVEELFTAVSAGYRGGSGKNVIVSKATTTGNGEKSKPNKSKMLVRERF
jgi:hypothetical protein